MIISTPAHFTAYLQALALQHPEILHVVTGEGSRGESKTLSEAQYPQLRIETPMSWIPRAESQKKISTRLYSLVHVPAGNDANDDIAANQAYEILEDLVSTITSHADTSEYGFMIIGEGIEINPIISLGSDQLRGWSCDIDIEVDRKLCKDRPFNPALFVMPQFRWTCAPEVEDNYAGAVITLEDLSIIHEDARASWYWQEEFQQPSIIELNDPNDGITITTVVDGPTYRIINVWLQISGTGDLLVWAFARIDSRQAAGTSVPFVPLYPPEAY
jgi:hypothetical protein